MLISWDGPLEGIWSYAILARQLISNGKEKLGWTVYDNLHHTPDGYLTDVLVQNDYPPRPPNLRHPQQVSIYTWEMRGVPGSIKVALQRFDRVWTYSQWGADVLTEAGLKNVVRGRLGVDTEEFRPLPLDAGMLPQQEGRLVVLWVGGTDPRHNFEAVSTLVGMTDERVLFFVKQSDFYPARAFLHPRVHYITERLPSLAPLYCSADVYLQTARAVGFGLPVLESLACGTPVLTGRLPPVQEMLQESPALAPHICTVDVTDAQAVQHHHHYTRSYWHEPDLPTMASMLNNWCVSSNRPPRVSAAAFRALQHNWSWESAARSLNEVLLW